jgi:hypothetical protein
MGAVASVIVDINLPWEKQPAYTPGEVLKLCQFAAVSKYVPVPTQRTLKGWLLGGAEPNEIEKKNKLNTSAIMYAAKGGHFKVIEILLKAGANVNQQNLLGDTALSIACSRIQQHRRFAQCAKLLLKHGADPNSVDKNGLVPLNWTAIHGHKGVTKKLLEMGASQNLWKNKAQRPAPMARSNGHKNVAEILQKAWDAELKTHENVSEKNEMKRERARRVEWKKKQEKKGNTWEDIQRKRKLERYEARKKKMEDTQAERTAQIRPNFAEEAEKAKEREERSKRQDVEAAWKRIGKHKVYGSSWAELFRGKAAKVLNAETLELADQATPGAQAKKGKRKKEESLNPANWKASDLVRFSGLFNLTRPIHIEPKEPKPQTAEGHIPEPPGNRVIQVKKYSPMEQNATIASSKKWHITMSSINVEAPDGVALSSHAVS